MYEDEDLMVVNKPPFLVTTKERENEKDTLEDYIREIKKIDLPRSGIVHRLDKGTSGLILIAKKQDVLDDLKRQFKERLVKKKYYSLVCGDVSFEGVIEAPIGRSKYSFGKFAVNTEGKQSRTEFKLIRKYKKNDKIYSLVDVDLKTGRTHQIRVHFNYLKWPLVGDKVYGGEIDMLNRPFLHSHSIEFVHPTSKELIKMEADLPRDLIECLKKYEEIKS